ncbi:MAG: metal-dependent hydrolase [Mariprofundaceae bacterium]|nr:metal-dependent hydrolase [Mariprofundaceae bacterium]
MRRLHHAGRQLADAFTTHADVDPLTHALSGAMLARALPKKPLAKTQIALLVLLTMIPDADFVLKIISDTTYLEYHRGITHSLLILPLWTWLFYALLSKTQASIPAWLIGAAIALHIGLDLITSFGTMILAPFSDWRAALDLVFIIDPLFTACLLLPLLGAAVFRRQARVFGLCALFLMLGYLALSTWTHQRAMLVVRHAHPHAISHAALPLPFSPFHWQLIASYPDHYVRAGINLLPSFPGSAIFFSAAFVKTYMPPLNEEKQLRWQTLPAMRAVQHIEGLPGVAFYLWFARFPVLLAHDDKHLEFGDLRFGAGIENTESPFRLRIEMKDIETGQSPRAWLIWSADRRSPLP